MNILHIIDYAGLGGGAEAVVFYSANAMPGKNFLYYYETWPNFNAQEFPNITFIKSRRNRSFVNLPMNVLELKRVIKNHKIDIVHSHLFWSNLTARLATPKSVKLFITIHNIQSLSSLQSKRAKRIERWSYRKDETTFCVSNVVSRDYKTIVPSAKTTVLYNFIGDEFFCDVKPYQTNGVEKEISFIAVGSVKAQKNYPFLLNVFSELKKRGKTNIRLDIFGKGELIQSLNNEVKAMGLNVNFKGEVLHLAPVYRKYDAFIMASLFEGFSISTMEAMASGLPLFLSDFEVMREMTGSNAIYFNVDSVDNCVEAIIDFSEKKYDVEQLINKERTWVNQVGRKSVYINNLLEYYNK